MNFTETQKEKINLLAEKYSLRLIFLFGSQVTGKTHKESDYDIAYLSGRQLSLEEEGRLINDLVPVVRVSDERMINLVNIKKMSPLLLYAATSSSQVLYEKEASSFANLRAYAFKLYVETAPLFKLRSERMGISTK